MKIRTIAGDLAETRAEAICTSTNPRLSLAMGTGGAVRERAGYEVLRECEAIVAAAGGQLAPGSAYATSAGALPAKALIHCVASDDAHRSSIAIIRSCVVNALACADARECKTIAMPVFATGHAHFNFDAALAAMNDALHDAKTRVEEVFIVVRGDAVEESESFWGSQ
jgi:O-acetyl-ADP-ribose deacetylase (regulator of RNase III)